MLFILLGIIVVVGALLLIFSNFSTGKKRNLPHTVPPQTEEPPRSARDDRPEPDEKVIYLFGGSGDTNAASDTDTAKNTERPNPKSTDPEDSDPEDDEA